MKTQFYVVWVGRVTGVYDNWKETDEQVHGYSGALDAGGFATRLEAEVAYKAGYEQYLITKQQKGKGGPALF